MLVIITVVRLMVGRDEDELCFLLVVTVIGGDFCN